MPEKAAKKSSLSFKTSTSWLFAEAKSDNVVLSAPTTPAVVGTSTSAASNPEPKPAAESDAYAAGHAPTKFNEDEQRLPSNFSDEYEVIDQIGEGAVCNVYRVKSSSLKREFALKVLKDDLLSNNAALKQFKKEVNASTDLTHANIAAVYGYGHTANGAPFVVTHLCEGTNLAQAVRDDGPFAIERALKLFIQISDAMAHAHFKSVVHRDLKPSNVVLSRNDNGEETARVIDFGMATVLQSARSAVTDVTKTGEVFGSPHYMSPEQCRGDKVDERSDIYSFGCLMYEVINGKQPFGGLNLVQVIMRQLNEAAPDFDETRPYSAQMEQLQKIVHRCLAKDPAQRYQHFDQLKNELQIVAAGGKLLESDELDPQATAESRIAASFIDGVIMAALVFVVGFVTDFTTSTESTHSFQNYWQWWLAISPEWWGLQTAWKFGSFTHLVDANDFLAGTYLVLSFLYHVLFEFSAFRATPGKLIMGLAVVNARGERISVFRAVTRFFAGLFQLPMTLLSMSGLLSPNRFRLDRPEADAWSGTYVVKRNNCDTFAMKGPQGYFTTKVMNLETVHRHRKQLMMIWLATAAALGVVLASSTDQFMWLTPPLLAWLPYLLSLSQRKRELLLERKQTAPDARSWWTGLLRNTLHGKAGQ
jgi:serine/threonine protein kinase